MEFYADASSILIAIYEIIVIIFHFINNFNAYHSLSKQLFFFKEINQEKSNNFDIFQKRKQIKEIISLIEKEEKNIDFVKSEISNKAQNDIIIKNKNKNKRRNIIKELNTEKIK